MEMTINYNILRNMNGPPAEIGSQQVMIIKGMNQPTEPDLVANSSKPMTATEGMSRNQARTPYKRNFNSISSGGCQPAIFEKSLIISKKVLNIHSEAFRNSSRQQQPKKMSSSIYMPQAIINFNTGPVAAHADSPDKSNLNCDLAIVEDPGTRRDSPRRSHAGSVRKRSEGGTPNNKVKQIKVNLTQQQITDSSQNYMYMNSKVKKATSKQGLRLTVDPIKDTAGSVNKSSSPLTKAKAPSTRVEPEQKSILNIIRDSQNNSQMATRPLHVKMFHPFHGQTSQAGTTLIGDASDIDRASTQLEGHQVSGQKPQASDSAPKGSAFNRLTSNQVTSIKNSRKLRHLEKDGSSRSGSRGGSQLEQARKMASDSKCNSQTFQSLNKVEPQNILENPSNLGAETSPDFAPSSFAEGIQGKKLNLQEKQESPRPLENSFFANQQPRNEIPYLSKDSSSNEDLPVKSAESLYNIIAITTGDPKQSKAQGQGSGIVLEGSKHQSQLYSSIPSAQQNRSNSRANARRASKTQNFGLSNQRMYKLEGEFTDTIMGVGLRNTMEYEQKNPTQKTENNTVSTFGQPKRHTLQHNSDTPSDSLIPVKIPIGGSEHSSESKRPKSGMNFLPFANQDYSGFQLITMNQVNNSQKGEEDFQSSLSIPKKADDSIQRMSELKINEQISLNQEPAMMSQKSNTAGQEHERIILSNNNTSSINILRQNEKSTELIKISENQQPEFTLRSSTQVVTQPSIGLNGSYVFIPFHRFSSGDEQGYPAEIINPIHSMHFEINESKTTQYQPAGQASTSSPYAVTQNSPERHALPGQQFSKYRLESSPTEYISEEPAPQSRRQISWKTPNSIKVGMEISQTSKYQHLIPSKSTPGVSTTQEKVKCTSRGKSRPKCQGAALNSPYQNMTLLQYMHAKSKIEPPSVYSSTKKIISQPVIRSKRSSNDQPRYNAIKTYEYPFLEGVPRSRGRTRIGHQDNLEYNNSLPRDFQQQQTLQSANVTVLKKAEPTKVQTEQRTSQEHSRLPSSYSPGIRPGNKQIFSTIARPSRNQSMMKTFDGHSSNPNFEQTQGTSMRQKGQQQTDRFASSQVRGSQGIPGSKQGSECHSKKSRGSRGGKGSIEERWRSRHIKEAEMLLKSTLKVQSTTNSEIKQIDNRRNDRGGTSQTSKWRQGSQLSRGMLEIPIEAEPSGSQPRSSLQQPSSPMPLAIAKLETEDHPRIQHQRLESPEHDCPIVAREGEIACTDISHDGSTAKKVFLSPKSSDLKDLEGVRTIKINQIFEPLFTVKKDEVVVEDQAAEPSLQIETKKLSEANNEGSTKHQQRKMSMIPCQLDHIIQKTISNMKSTGSIMPVPSRGNESKAVDKPSNNQASDLVNSFESGESPGRGSRPPKVKNSDFDDCTQSHLLSSQQFAFSKKSYGNIGSHTAAVRAESSNRAASSNTKMIITVEVNKQQEKKDPPVRLKKAPNPTQQKSQRNFNLLNHFQQEREQTQQMISVLQKRLKSLDNNPPGNQAANSSNSNTLTFRKQEPQKNGLYNKIQNNLNQHNSFGPLNLQSRQLVSSSRQNARGWNTQTKQNLVDQQQRSQSTGQSLGPSDYGAASRNMPLGQRGENLVSTRKVDDPSFDSYRTEEKSQLLNMIRNPEGATGGEAGSELLDPQDLQQINNLVTEHFDEDASSYQQNLIQAKLNSFSSMKPEDQQFHLQQLQLQLHQQQQHQSILMHRQRQQQRHMLQLRQVRQQVSQPVITSVVATQRMRNSESRQSMTSKTRAFKSKQLTDELPINQILAKLAPSGQRSISGRARLPSRRLVERNPQNMSIRHLIQHPDIVGQQYVRSSRSNNQINHIEASKKKTPTPKSRQIRQLVSQQGIAQQRSGAFISTGRRK